MTLAAIGHSLFGRPDQLSVGTKVLTVGDRTDYKAGTITAADFQTTIVKIRDIHEKDLATHKAETAKTVYDKSLTVEVEETVVNGAEDEGSGSQSQRLTTTYDVKIIKHPNQNSLLSFVKHHPVILTSAAVALLAVGVAAYNPERTLEIGSYAWNCVSSYPGLNQCFTEGTNYATQLYHTLAQAANTTVTCLTEGPTIVNQVVVNQVVEACPTAENLAAVLNTTKECLKACTPIVDELQTPVISVVEECINQCIITAAENIGKLVPATV